MFNCLRLINEFPQPFNASSRMYVDYMRLREITKFGLPLDVNIGYMVMFLYIFLGLKSAQGTRGASGAGRGYLWLGLGPGDEAPRGASELKPLHWRKGSARLPSLSACGGTDV